MILQSIRLQSFRSYRQGAFSFRPGVNILCGDNGRGKTNLLEAIWSLTGLRSWRCARKGEMVCWDAPEALLQGTVLSHGRELELKLRIPAAGRSAAWINGVKKQRQAELSQALRCVLFSPEDLQLVKGPAAGRRAFLDDALCQMRPRYEALLARYEKLLESKSRLLKQDPPPETALVASFDQQLSLLGAQLVGYRARFCRGLREESARLHSAISGGKERLDLQYRTVSTVTDPFAPPETVAAQLSEHLESHRQAELAAGQCLSGLHKDDLELFLNDRSARAYASQGQTRSAALALKFGQRELFYRDGGEYPLLLLDDVLSELDAPRQAFVATHAMGGQSIITCCEERREFTDAGVIRL